MPRKQDGSLIGRRVICPDSVKGRVTEEYPRVQRPQQGVLVERDDSVVELYALSAVKLIEPRTHTKHITHDTRLSQLIAEYASLADAAARFEELKAQIKAETADLSFADAGTGVAWEDGDSVEVDTGALKVRVYPMNRVSIDVEKMKAEYPQGYAYFLKRTSTLALKLLK